MRKMKKMISLAMTFAMILCLASCGNANRPVNAEAEEIIEKEIPDSMDTSDVADMLESGMTVDEVIDRVEEVKENESAATDKPAEASPTQTPVSTPAPTAKPTPEPTATPQPTPTPTPLHVHEYTAESITTQATCATAGVKTLTCSCGEVKTEQIPATGQHNWVEDTNVIHHEAIGHVSTTEVQVQVGTEMRQEYECKSCGARFNTPDEKVEHGIATGDFNHATCGTIIHDIPGSPIYETQTQSQWVVDQEAWDETVGTGTYTCTVCGTTK